MRKSRFTKEQIIGILAEQERGQATGDVCRRHGISTTTFYKCKANARKLGTLETENARLKRLLADSMLDVAVLKDLLGKS